VDLIIVEDEYLTRELIKHFIENSALEIHITGEADNGEDGFRLLQETKPDILITDMRMPFKDGVDLLKLLEQHDLKTKIIVLSGHDDFIYTSQAIRSGVVEYLLKPVDPSQLKQALLQCVKRINQDIKRHAANSMVVFSAEIIKLISAYKKHIQLLLTEHNFEPIRLYLEQCIGKLQDELADSPELWRRIYQELVALLGEYSALGNQELDGEEDVNIVRLVDVQSITSSNDLLKTLNASYEETIRFVTERLRNRRKINMEEVYRYVQDHYANEISLEVIANLFHVSKEYLSKTYKMQFGENLMEHIRRLRMVKARELIMDNRMQIKHIATSVGYVDVSYFYRVFKKFYGISPNSLRM
jgi:two-component system response regulator YesN